MSTKDARGNLHDELGRFTSKDGSSRHYVQNMSYGEIMKADREREKSRFTDATSYIDLLKSEGYNTDSMTEEWAKEHCNYLGLKQTSGAVSGAVDPNSKRGKEHAKRFYEEIRHRKDDVPAISKNTGLSIETVEKIKHYIFIDKHNLEEGYQRFYPDCDMAISWQRLVTGNHIPPDVIMLQHEIMEISLVEKGMSQQEAHRITNQKYNYSQAIDEWRKKNGSNK